MEIKPTMTNFQLDDGSVIQLTLNLMLLYRLKSLRKDAYERFNNVMVKGPQDVFDNLTVVYTAYLCANIDTIDACTSYADFMQRASGSIQALTMACQDLINPKKKTASGVLSAAE